MKIFVCASKHNYHLLKPVMKELERKGHSVTPPNSFDEPFKEDEVKKQSTEDHIKWKSKMIRLQKEKIAQNDAILVFNWEKHGQKNYIGGATFLEIFQAFDLGKKIYLMNPMPEGIFHDELTGMNPMILNGNLDLVK